MKDFIIRYWIEFLFGTIIAGLGAAYKSLWKKVSRQITDQKALKQGTQALLRNQIIHSYDKYIEKQWIPIYAMENVLALYCAYSTLGGNGTMTKLVRELKELPSSEPKGVTV